jgi:hypothetical protein
MATSRFESELREEDRIKREATGVAKKRAQARRDQIGAEEKAGEQMRGAVRQRTGQAIAASYNPFQTGGGGQIAGLSQVAMQRGAEEGGIEADVTRRVAERRVGAEEAELEALAFEKKATFSARQELKNVTAEYNQFVELDRGAEENARELGRLAQTVRDPEVYKQLLTMMANEHQGYANRYIEQYGSNRSRSNPEDL